MKIICYFLVILLLQEARCGIIRNPPAFSKPNFSDSYLPAAMQVIFHAVEQLKILQSEEETQSSTSIALMAQNQRTSTEQSPTASIQSLNETKVQGGGEKKEESKTEEPSKDETDESEIEETSKEKLEESKLEDTTSKEKGEQSKDKEAPKDKVEDSKIVETSKETTEADRINQESIGEPSMQHQESAEVNEETPEVNYATPETNYETPEGVYTSEETNREILKQNCERTSSLPRTETKLEETTVSGNSTDLDQTIVGNDEKKKPTIDSIVQDVYQILKPTTSKFVDEDSESSGREKSKSSAEDSVTKMESVEEEDDENRFTRLGEKVTQVPRPSLSSYLRRSKVPPSATLQQLANLYDSLSKDARKQGFGKYTGYSDQVLDTLETSAEGGIGPQLKKILTKVLDRNELTREDARMRTSKAIRDLDDPSSSLNKELRPLLPLRYSP